jgi:hypothetical protein
MRSGWPTVDRGAGVLRPVPDGDGHGPAAVPRPLVYRSSQLTSSSSPGKPSPARYSAPQRASLGSRTNWQVVPQAPGHARSHTQAWLADLQHKLEASRPLGTQATLTGAVRRAQ